MIRGGVAVPETDSDSAKSEANAPRSRVGRDFPNSVMEIALACIEAQDGAT